MSGVVLPFSKSPSDLASARGFRSFKTSESIVYTRRCCRDALIQATLDESIRQIGTCDTSDLPHDTFFSFSVVMGNKSCAVAVCDSSSGLISIKPKDFDLSFAISRSALLSEPICTVARTVWASRDELVPPDFQVELLHFLSKNSSAVALGELRKLVALPENWVSAILSLACRGIIAIDFRRPLSDRTTVRSTERVNSVI